MPKRLSRTFAFALLGALCALSACAPHSEDFWSNASYHTGDVATAGSGSVQ